MENGEEGVCAGAGVVAGTCNKAINYPATMILILLSNTIGREFTKGPHESVCIPIFAVDSVLNVFITLC